jgi:predicted ATPase
VIRTPDQRLRVFVSSTLDELAPERVAVRRAIEQLHLTPVMFELGARPHPPRELYRAYLAQSHIFVGIYWQRYGWVAPDESVSGLEDEYVLSAGTPRLLYLKTPAPDREGRLSDLIERMQSEDTASYRHFETPDELARLVQEDLAILLSERFEATHARPAASPATILSSPPLPRTPTVGRDRDIAAVTGLLRSGTRLLTLSGAGGIGKTRLALEVAQRLADEFGSDLYYVSVESVTSPELLLRTIADRLQVRLEDTRGPLHALVEYFRDRRSLLLLDNFEQVVDAAAQVAALLDGCPRLQVLVTSRQVLRLQAEREYPVAPLDVPAEDTAAARVLAQVPAVQLFVQRAQAARPGFELTSENAAVVAELCRRLDGLPLAIELAAAWIRLLSPEALLERIERRLDLLASGGPDLPARQRTLRATLDWSHQLLAPSEQALFARLSVFAGGATLEAIEAVCRDEDGPDLLNGLSSLLDKSLLASSEGEAVGQPRLQMLQTVRDYARERLAERDETARFGDRHLDWFLSASEPANVLRNPDAYSYWPTIEPDTDNFRAAVRWALERGALHPLAVLSSNLFPWFWQSGRLLEARAWLDEAVGLLDPDTDANDAARLLVWAAAARVLAGDLEGAEPMVIRAASTFRQLGEESDAAWAQILRAGVLLGSGRPDEVVDDELDGALRVMRTHEIDWGVGYGAFTQGSLASLRGDVAGARTANEEALAAAGRIGLEPLQVLAQIQLALLDLAQGGLDQTRRRLNAAAETVERIRYVEGTGYALDAAAGLAVAEGRLEAAAAALRTADDIRDRLRMPIWPLLRPMHDSLVAASSGHRPPNVGGDPWVVLRQTLASAERPTRVER